MCRESTKQVEELDVAQLMPWKLDGNQTASQHFTSKDSMLEMLDKECVGKVWITSVLGPGRGGKEPEEKSLKGEQKGKQEKK